MKTTMVVLEIVLELLLCCLLYGAAVENPRRDKTSRMYLILLGVVMTGLAGDIVAWSLDNTSELLFLQRVGNGVSFVTGEIAVTVFAYYELELVRAKKNVSSWHARGVALFNGVMLLITVYGFATRRCFRIENGSYIYGEWYWIDVYAAVITLVYLFALTMYYRRVLGKHDTAALCAYMLMPLLGGLLENAEIGVETTYIATAMSLLVIYVMLQSGQVSELKRHGLRLEEMTYRDTLTGLFNRRAYTEKLGYLDPNGTIGVVFCDVNGLKYTNDNFGHAAGDKLLMEFSKLLIHHFPKECVYRISGDEYVALIPNPNALRFDRRLTAFQADISASGDIAAVGSTVGNCTDVMQLVAEAENAMYADKQRFHESHPEQARK